jgi:hypothetical protein
MKTSKIIFISFFSILGLFLLSLIIQHKPPKDENKNHYEEYTLTPFSHLVIMGNSSVTLKQGDVTQVKFCHSDGKFGDSTLIGKYDQTYSIKNDTLTIICPDANKVVVFSIHANALKYIDMQAGNLNIENLDCNEMTLIGKGSQITIDAQSAFHNSIRMSLTEDSRLTWYLKNHLPQLDLQLEHSQAFIASESSTINLLNARLQYNSEFTTTNVAINHRVVETDTTSRNFSN